MAREPRDYIKLSRRGVRFGILSSRLWLARDHVLLVNSQLFQEVYRRFYFTDIQAIVVRTTARRLLWNLAFLAPGAALGSLALTPAVTNGNPTATAVLLAMGAVLIGLALFNTLLGPTAHASLRTATNSEVLHPIKRLRTAHRILARLRPLIEEAQGGMDAGTLRSQFEQLTLNAPQRVQPEGRPVSAGTLTLFQIVFAGLLADGLLTAVDFFADSVLLNFVVGAVRLLTPIAVVIALVKQYQGFVPAGIRAVNWGAFAYFAIILLLGYVNQIVFAMKNPERSLNYWDMWKSSAMMAPDSSIFRLATYIFAMVCPLLLSLAGWILLPGFRRARAGLEGKDT